MAVFYNPPGNINDYDRRPGPMAETLKQDWHNFIAARISGRDRGLFYDAANDPQPQTPATRTPVPWNGFPLSIFNWFRADSDPAGMENSLRTAEVLRPITAVFRQGNVIFTSLTRDLEPLRRMENGVVGEPIFPLHRQQDEYCEWHIDRDNNGGITRISYTAEGPEYWQRMARHDMSLVIELYREYVSTSVQEPDLVWPFDVVARDPSSGNFRRVFRRGEYNPYNRFNTTQGVMHLTHPANTLGAEINLAADAAELFPVPTQPANTLATRLICCALYGEVNRSSDPAIGAGVNGLARDGKSATLANPVGLYISTVGISGLRSPTGAQIGAQALKVRRSSADESMKLRVEVRVPEGAGFTLDQCTFDQRPLRFGGQIALKITMVLFGLAKTIPGRVGVNRDCGAKCCGNPDAPKFIKPFRLNTNCNDVRPEDFGEDGPVTEQMDVINPFAAEAGADRQMTFDADAPEPEQDFQRARPLKP